MGIDLSREEGTKQAQRDLNACCCVMLNRSECEAFTSNASQIVVVYSFFHMCACTGAGSCIETEEERRRQSAKTVYTRLL